MKRSSPLRRLLGGSGVVGAAFLEEAEQTGWRRAGRSGPSPLAHCLLAHAQLAREGGLAEPEAARGRDPVSIHWNGASAMLHVTV